MFNIANQIFTQTYWDARSLSKARAHYYEYFARLMQASDGRMTVLKFFQNESQRYAGQARGRVSELFVDRIGMYGSDLVKIWEGVFPDSDLMVIAAAQEGGLEATIKSLNTLAKMTQMATKARQDFMAVIFVGLLAISVALGMLFIFPSIALTQYSTVFGNLPYEIWPEKALTLAAISAFGKNYWWLVLVLTVALLGVFFWSLKHWVGSVRKWVDNYLPYRLYRDYHGAMFLSLLAVLSANRSRGGNTLRASLATLETHASPWLAWHIREMISNVDNTSQREGVSLEVFDTGILSKDNLYLMQDIGDGLGVSEALARTSELVSHSVVESVAKNAGKLRWLMLLVGLVITGYVFYISNAAGSQLIESTKLYFQTKQ